jgi:hypothetical protein
VSGIEPNPEESDLEPEDAEHRGRTSKPNGRDDANEATVRRSKSAADFLIELAGEADLFHTRNGSVFVDIAVNGHRETWSARSRGFQHWLRRLFYRTTGGAPSGEAMQSALGVIEAKANFDGPAREVFVRVGGVGDRLYIDLGDEAWRAIEVSAAGWRVVDEPEVRFRREPGMTELPTPARGGSIDLLRPFLNVRSDDDFRLAVAWTLAALRHVGPFSLLAVSGEHGTAKTTFLVVVRSLIDPHLSPKRSLPRSVHDLYIGATRAGMLAFDNLSGISAEMSDALCQISTGGAHAARTLYSDDDETLLEAMRPIILNGIDDIVTRADLADRAIFLTLEPINEDKRRVEAEFFAQFEAEKPQIFGALLDGLVVGLAKLATTKLDGHPRMADFAKWATACETAYWPAGSFGVAYNTNRKEVVQKVIDADPVAAAVQKLMVERTEWQGTATELLAELAIEAGDRVSRFRSWPASARGLSSRIRRSAPFLRAQGLTVITDQRRSANARSISIIKSGSPPKVRDSASFASSPTSPKEVSALAADATDDANRDWEFASSFASHSKPLAAQANDGDDANDAESPREKEGPLPSRYNGTAGIAGENVNNVKGRSVSSGLGTDMKTEATEDPVLSKIVPSVPPYQGKRRDDFLPDDATNLGAFSAGRDGLI